MDDTWFSTAAAVSLPETPAAVSTNKMRVTSNVLTLIIPYHLVTRSSGSSDQERSVFGALRRSTHLVAA
jgi:hypothetical protein